jgi:hypothetical protein
MSEHGTLTDFRFNDSEAVDDIRGTKIYDRDDNKLGTIDDVIFHHSTGIIEYVVVDTGGWLSSKKFIVPPEQLHVSAKHDGQYATNLDKKRIETFPPYEETSLHNDENWKKYEQQYQRSWVDNPVQHVKGSDRDITPTTSQMPPEPGSIASQLDEEELEDVQPRRFIRAGEDEAIIDTNATGLGSRWSNFEQRLRERRKEIADSSQRRSAARADEIVDDTQERLRRAS